jgi:dTDP-4-amino-4,6-dideoxygalactose transaminase
MIRLTIPSIEQEDLEAVRAVLETGFLVQGPEVAAFEDEIASYVGTRYAVAVSNCTAALHLSLLALEIKPGNLVVTTTYSWPATSNVIELCGAQPVFVDIDPETFNINPDKLDWTLSKLFRDSETANQVKAILPVHTFGQMADMPTILNIAENYKIPVVEDAACALGATIGGREAGSWGKMGCFSFHPRKAITTGEGGVITTNDSCLARRLRILRNHGLDPESSTTNFVVPGYNYRMTDFQAALGRSQLSKIDRIIKARREAASNYDLQFANTMIQAPVVSTEHNPVYQSYVVKLPAIARSQQQALIQQLRKQGIETTIGTWHIPLTSYYRTHYDYSPGDFPVTDEVFAGTLTLPLYEGLKVADQKVVAKELRKAVDDL